MAGKSAAVRVAILGDNSSLKHALDESHSKLKGFGKAIAVSALAAGTAVAFLGLAKIGSASIQAASDAQQSVGGTQAVFGKFAANVIKTSNEASSQFGLSANQYRESANIIGSLLKNQGVSQDKLAGSTKNLVKTGADLAATYGGPASAAVDALGSAFKGEFDPLQQYGITLKQSMINAEALRVAHVKTTAQFNKLSTATQLAAQRQATQNLIVKQSTSAQGQFQKQTSTLAEQQQILGANVDNLKTKVGKALLPAFTLFVRKINNVVVPGLNRLARKYLPGLQDKLKDLSRDYLPKISHLLDDLFKGNPGGKAKVFGDALSGIDWAGIKEDGNQLLGVIKDLAPTIKNVSFNTVNSSIKVFGVLVGIAADHTEALKKALRVPGRRIRRAQDPAGHQQHGRQAVGRRASSRSRSAPRTSC